MEERKEIIIGKPPNHEPKPINVKIMRFALNNFGTER